MKMKTALAITLVFLTGVFANAEGEKISIPAGEAVVGADVAELESQIEDPRAKKEWYSDEGPKKKVALKSFFIDKTEVTNKMYKDVIADHKYPANLASHPVVNATWEMADTYCRKAGGRLPTEAEWERAARGNEGFIYPWGDKFVGGNANYADSAGASKMKVGSFEQETSAARTLGGTAPADSIKSGASPFGVLGMAGGVWEWVDGWYDEKKGLRILKGGSWLSPAASLRSSTRLSDEGDAVYNDYGFRCAYDKK